MGVLFSQQRNRCHITSSPLFCWSASSQTELPAWSWSRARAASTMFIAVGRLAQRRHHVPGRCSLGGIAIAMGEWRDRLRVSKSKPIGDAVRTTQRAPARSAGSDPLVRAQLRTSSLHGRRAMHFELACADVGPRKPWWWTRATPTWPFLGFQRQAGDPDRDPSTQELEQACRTEPSGDQAPDPGDASSKTVAGTAHSGRH